MSNQYGYDPFLEGNSPKKGSRFPKLNRFRVILVILLIAWVIVMAFVGTRIFSTSATNCVGESCSVLFRSDSGSANPDHYERISLEKAEGTTATLIYGDNEETEFTCSAGEAHTVTGTEQAESVTVECVSVSSDRTVVRLR